jgi:hypothetical protein
MVKMDYSYGQSEEKVGDREESQCSQGVGASCRSHGNRIPALRITAIKLVTEHCSGVIIYLQPGRTIVRGTQQCAPSQRRHR